MEDLAGNGTLIVGDRVADDLGPKLDSALHSGELVPLLGAGPGDADGALRLVLGQCGREPIERDRQRRLAVFDSPRWRGPAIPPALAGALSPAAANPPPAWYRYRPTAVGAAAGAILNQRKSNDRRPMRWVTAPCPGSGAGSAPSRPDRSTCPRLESSTPPWSTRVVAALSNRVLRYSLSGIHGARWSRASSGNRVASPAMRKASWAAHPAAWCCPCPSRGVPLNTETTICGRNRR